MKKKLKGWKQETDKPTVGIGNFNTVSLATDRNARQIQREYRKP